MTGPRQEESGPVVELWIDDHPDGLQSVFVTGEDSDGDRFFASFFQPTIGHTDEEGVDRVW